MKATILLISIASASILLTGCNTMKGVGEDISGSASYVQDKMSGDTSVKNSDSQYVQNPPQFPKAN